MKISHLHLLAFGPFTKSSLDFSADSRDFHMVYGSNEAGKSTFTSIIRHVLYGVGPWDLATILGVPFVLSCVAAGAALIPAFRASQVDPVKALKTE